MSDTRLAAVTWQIDTTAAGLLELGESIYFASEHDSARVVLQQALEAAAAAADSVSYAGALTWLGLTAWRQGRYPDARELGERALALKERLALRDDLFRSLNALGLLARDEGRLAEASDLFERALRAAREVGDSMSAAKALANSGLVRFDMGDFAGARDGFRALREAAVGNGDARAEATALTNLALVEIRLGDNYSAVESLTRALELFRAIDFPTGEENALGQMGTAYAGAGDPHRGVAYLDSALRVARRHGLMQPESEDLQLLASLFSEMGEHSRAVEYLAQARRLSTSLEQRGRLGDIARAEARAYAALGREDLAQQRAAEALALHRVSGSRMEELLDLLALAELAQRANRSADADRSLRAAAALAQQLDVPVARGHVALGSARVADERGLSVPVIEALSGGRPDVARLGPAAEGEAFALEARAHARAGRLGDAVMAGRAAVASLELVRQRIAAGPLRVSFTADRSSVYGDLVINLLQLARTEEAFQVADAARSRALLERVAAARGGSARDATAGFADAERLLGRIDWLVERLRQADTIPERERSQREYAHVSTLAQMLAAARREYETALHTAISQDTGRAALLGAQSMEVAAVQRSLAPGEVLLQFFVTPERLVSFVVTRRSVHPLEARIGAAEVAMRARVAHDAVSRGQAHRGEAAALRGLHELLIAPAEKLGLLRGVRSIVLVPHGSLVHVPFAALVNSSERYLMEDYSLLTVPSASALVAMRRPRQPERRGVSVFAPFPERLPGTRTEAVAVSRAARGTKRWIGASASEKSVRTALSRPGVVHVASHAVLNELAPMFSGVELAVPRQRHAADDGRLEVHELLGMNVQSDLVFLSGCETAAGAAWTNSFRRGQDYATLAQAFLYAGARDVVATLWRIDDRGASAFAEKFYEALSSLSTVDAVAAAQRAMISDVRYAAPRYWAAYTVSGAGVAKAPGSGGATAGSFMKGNPQLRLTWGGQ